MDIQEKAKRILRKYRLQTNLVWLAVALIVFAVYMLAIYSIINPLSAILALVVAFILRILIVKRLYYDRIDRIIVNDLDIELYKEVIRIGNIYYVSGSELLIPAMMTGDYQSAIDICADRSTDPKCAKISWYYLVRRAHIYFELDDRDALRAVCDEFEHLVKYAKNGNVISGQAPVFTFYRSYVNEDLSACEAYLQTATDGVNTSFRTALLYYRSGDPQRAKPYFETVIDRAPHLHSASVAQAYLEAIETDTPYVNTVATPVPTPGYTTPRPPKALKKRRMIRTIISGVIIGITVFALLILSVSYYMKDGEQSYIDSKYTAAVQTHYPDAKILHQFLLKENGETIENMCIVETADGAFVVGYLYTYQDSEDDTFYFSGFRKIQVGNPNFNSGYVSGAMISYMLTDDKGSIPDGVYYWVELETAQGTLYFYVDDIVDLNDYFPDV
ncbi:MAG: hypothetical protein IJX47_05715 [Clostridia bacterium]|nr:hypothetical protein [Clostridia bacterium]